MIAVERFLCLITLLSAALLGILIGAATVFITGVPYGI